MTVKEARAELKELTPILDACIARVSLGHELTALDRARLAHYHELAVYVAEMAGKR